MQTILQVLLVISILLTLRAFHSQTWATMWLAALVSLSASLLTLWSLGSLLFLLTCLQLAAAVAMRRSRNLRAWGPLLFAGVATFGMMVYGLAFLRLWDFWVIAFPLAFIAWSMPLRPRHITAHQHPLTPVIP